MPGPPIVVPIPCWFLYVVYATTDYTTALSLQPVRTPPRALVALVAPLATTPPVDRVTFCNSYQDGSATRISETRSTSGALSPRDKASEWAVQCLQDVEHPQSSSPTAQSQGYLVPRKGRRRHRQSITVPKHHIPTGIGHWGQAELETDATKHRTSGKERGD